MRDIRFRAWDKDDRRFAFLIISNHSNIPKTMPFGQWNLDVWQQYTGLKDKNGKASFESDIIKRFGEVGVIRWDDIEARFRIYMDDNNPMPRNYPLSNTLDWEVIGNIWENPELLNRR